MMFVPSRQAAWCLLLHHSYAKPRHQARHGNKTTTRHYVLLTITLVAFPVLRLMRCLTPFLCLWSLNRVPPDTTYRSARRYSGYEKWSEFVFELHNVPRGLVLPGEHMSSKGETRPRWPPLLQAHTLQTGPRGWGSTLFQYSMLCGAP